MNVIAVIDDGGGLMFNRRRQSQDRVLRERILRLSDGSRLWMNAYTRKQFDDTDADGRISVDEDFLEKAAAGDYCFVENAPILPVLERVERVILFRWNRAYPSDMKLDIDLSAPEWNLVESDEFPGYSHEKITEEVYIRET